MSDFATWVIGRRRRTAETMTDLSGDISACAMGRNGRSLPSFKYHEGASAAPGALARELRRGGEERGSVEKVLQEWQTIGSVGGDWEAYAAGGREALEEARGQLAAM